MYLTLLVITLPYVLLQIIFVYIESYYMMIFHNLIYALSIFVIFKGGCTDPGIIPRQYGNNAQLRDKNYYVVINGSLVNINYCHTCSIYKPPRTSHFAIIVAKDSIIIAYGLGLVWEKEIINIFIY